MPSILAQEILKSALSCLKQGLVIAYPTEAVYGLGCDPFNLSAVQRLLTIKGRSMEKGLILVASEWSQIESLIEPIPPPSLAQIFSTWPGPNTWVFPANQHVPDWIKGRHSTIALRISAHPIIQELCRTFASPLVSTSANRESELPLRDTRSVEIMFGKQIDFIVPGKVGGQANPTTIRDAITGEYIRI
jgi:L-threonylcarbamoyladenylate synthase